MTAVTVTDYDYPEARIGLATTLSDIGVVTGRNVLRLIRSPGLVVFSTIQPVMFVLLFAFVFGGAIDIPGVDYVNFLLPGIFAQSSLFGSTNTGIALFEDLDKGIIDRFRSLPMARSAVLAGRTLADAARNLFVLLLMTVVGYLIGFRFQDGVVNAVLALGIMLLFGFTFSWVSANVGLRAKNAEMAQVGGFLWVFPLVFASSAFVPTDTMPAWLEAFAVNNPVTIVVNTVRSLVLGPELSAQLGLGSQGSNIVRALLWMAGLLLVLVPLAVNRYRKAA